MKSHQIVNQIYNFILEEFEKLNSNIEAMQLILCLKNLEVILIYSYKSFYDSGKFKKLVENLTSVEKAIYVLKFEDFDIDENFKDTIFVVFLISLRIKRTLLMDMNHVG